MNYRRQNRLIGEKGAVAHRDVGDLRVALFFSIVRDVPSSKIMDFIDDCLREAEIHPESAIEIVTDLFLLTFQTRNCRGGKGEKDLFFSMLVRLYSSFPATVLLLLGLVPRYGTFKDFFRIMDFVGRHGGDQYDMMKRRIISIVAKYILRDSFRLDE